MLLMESLQMMIDGSTRISPIQLCLEVQLSKYMYVKGNLEGIIKYPWTEVFLKKIIIWMKRKWKRWVDSETFTWVWASPNGRFVFDVRVWLRGSTSINYKDQIWEKKGLLRLFRPWLGSGTWQFFLVLCCEVVRLQRRLSKKVSVRLLSLKRSIRGYTSVK